MARKPRIETEGGLYHIITRGVDRRDIFHSPEDRQRFISLLTRQKELLPFYLYAYCLMSNHIHLLIERMTDDIGRIMHRLLTGYTQYYNRRYGRSGHLLQGRHKAILCQSDRYLTKLVSYIHLNPVRAKMVTLPEDYPYSSHRAYLDLEPAGVVDVDPVLRHFGPRRSVARQRFAKHVAAGMGEGHLSELYEAPDGVLGTEEFVDSMIHRIGEYDVHAAARRRNENKQPLEFTAETLIAAVESVVGVPKMDFYGTSKTQRVVLAKEALVLAGRRSGANTTTLAHLLGLSSASVSRRYDVALRRSREDEAFSGAISQILNEYARNLLEES